MECAILTEEDRNLNIEVYREATHRWALALWLSSPTGAQVRGRQNPKPLAAKDANESSEC